jgi:SOUL heme-binding protein
MLIVDLSYRMLRGATFIFAICLSLQICCIQSFGTNSFIVQRSGISSLVCQTALHVLQNSRGGSLEGDKAVIVTPHDGSYIEFVDLENVTVDDCIFKLNEAICTFNSSAAADLLVEIKNSRERSTNTLTTEEFLNELLRRGPDQRLPIWTMFRPLSRVSKRARLASLRRTLDATTPPPNESDGEMEKEFDDSDQQRRRRRALVSLLRTLASPRENMEVTSKLPAIVELERKSKRRISNMDDLASRRPSDLETPEYDIVQRRLDAGYEIRQYKPFSVCSVSMNAPRPMDSERTDAKLGEPKVGGARAFGALAGYLFGKNQQETAMKMTAPVLTNGQGDSKRMSFVLPSKYWNEDGLSLAPTPLDGSGVQLLRRNNESRAVIMFGGYASKQEVDKKKSKLVSSILKDKEWEIVDADSITLAQYNDPFTPPWKRLNEVSVEVSPRS